MYTYFTRDQVLLLAQHLQPDFTDSQLDQWEKDNHPALEFYFKSERFLPPIFAIAEATHLVIDGHWTPATIHAIHIIGNGVKYDLDLLLSDGERQRIYNVSPALIARPEWEKPQQQLPEQVNLVNKMFSHFK